MTLRQLGFNSATAVMPWKTRRACRTRGANGCFNSATAVMPWKTPLPTTSGTNLPGFNSATAVMPWKTVQKLKDECVQVIASIRPRR